MPIYFGGKLAERCPLIPYRDNPDWYHQTVEAFAWYKKGFFPEPGTYKDQPAKLIDSFQVIEGVQSEIEERERKRSDAKAKAAQKSAKRKGR